MSIYNLFDVNEDLETKGFILEMVEGDAKIEFVIARAGGANKKFSKRVQQLLKPHQQAWDRGTLDENMTEKIFNRALAEHVVLGWTGITDRDGEELEYSVENCMKLLTDLPDLKEIIFDEAKKVSNFIDAERLENGKKSVASSIGNSEEESKPSKSKKPQSKED